VQLVEDPLGERDPLPPLILPVKVGIPNPRGAMDAVGLAAGSRIWPLHHPRCGVQAVEVVHRPRRDPLHLSLPVALLILGQRDEPSDGASQL
jgi:hypothetical protein